MNASASCGTTPLLDAAANGHEKIVKILLKHGADPLQSNRRGTNALDLAFDSNIDDLLRNHLQQQHIDTSEKDSNEIKSFIRNDSSPNILICELFKIELEFLLFSIIILADICIETDSGLTIMDSSNEPKSPTAHKSPIISETYSTLKNTNSNQMSKKSKELDSSDFYLSPSPGLQSRHSIEQANKMSQMNDKINLADGSVSTDTTQPVSISISKKDDQDQLKWTVSNVIGCFIPNDMAEIKIDSNQSKTKDNQDMNTDLTKSTEKVTSIDSKLSLSAETTPLVLSKNEEKPKDFLQNSSNSRTKKSDDLTKEESTSSSTVSLNLSKIILIRFD